MAAISYEVFFRYKRSFLSIADANWRHCYRIMLWCLLYARIILTSNNHDLNDHCSKKWLFRSCHKTTQAPSCLSWGLALWNHTINLKQLKTFIMICLNAISFLYPTQLVTPNEVAIAVKKLMAIWRMVFQVSAFILLILIQFLKVKLNILCVSREVNFPLVC